ncbi:MAG: type II toxin-antitoxin system VapC family toxin [Anaerolineales bacterium]|nr:type II toxin-antitoxin system VapC family toxin [Anaerolineales bacterium]MBX3036065.1 type II toxin-antitoxin system VapC family toxin [Anaerolineales bacterium]
MILYIDTSALVKRYIDEEGTDEVIAWMNQADIIGTALVTRAELVATLTRATRGNRSLAKDFLESLDEFRGHWSHYQHINIDDALIIRADSLASIYALRGYDAIHLACALTWQDLLNSPITLATFDKELHEAAEKSGIQVFP